MIASSTTIPIANTNPNMVSVLMVNPSGMKKQNVPNMETGMARTGISVERRFCRNRNTTIATRPSVFNSVQTTSDMDTFTTVTDSNGTLYSTSAGKDCLSKASTAYTPLAVLRALLPGAW